jgi:hypothetical protein
MVNSFSPLSVESKEKRFQNAFRLPHLCACSLQTNSFFLYFSFPLLFDFSPLCELSSIYNPHRTQKKRKKKSAAVSPCIVVSYFSLHGDRSSSSLLSSFVFISLVQPCSYKRTFSPFAPTLFFFFSVVVACACYSDVGCTCDSALISSERPPFLLFRTFFFLLLTSFFYFCFPTVCLSGVFAS